MRMPAQATAGSQASEHPDGVQQMTRIVLLGTTGSGKSTLGIALAEHLQVPPIELDAWNHGVNWTPTPREEFRARISDLSNEPSWVVDGNYLDLVGPLVARSRPVVWLDMPLTGAPSLCRWFQMNPRCTPGPHRAIAPLARPSRSSVSSARSGGPGRTDWLQG